MSYLTIELDRPEGLTGEIINGQYLLSIYLSTVHLCSMRIFFSIKPYFPVVFRTYQMQSIQENINIYTDNVTFCQKLLFVWDVIDVEYGVHPVSTCI